MALVSVAHSFLTPTSWTYSRRKQFLGAAVPCVKAHISLRKTSFKINAFFRFGNRDAKGAGIYGSQKRDDFNRDDVEQYFNYMGMLATEGSYDKMDALLDQGIHPVDILLLLAALEGDKPKIEELLRAGANYDVKDADGRTALERAKDDEIRELIQTYAAKPT